MKSSSQLSHRRGIKYSFGSEYFIVTSLVTGYKSVFEASIFHIAREYRVLFLTLSGRRSFSFKKLNILHSQDDALASGRS